MVGEGRGGEQRRPGRVGLRARVAVHLGLADRGDRPPEVPVVLVVPAADRPVGAGEVGHREEPGGADDVEPAADDHVPQDPVPERRAVVLPPDRSVRLVGRPDRKVIWSSADADAQIGEDDYVVSDPAESVDDLGSCSLIQSSANPATSCQPSWAMIQWVRPGNSWKSVTAEDVAYLR